MRLWQQTMIALAHSRRMQHLMQTHAGMTRLAGRFVGGGDPSTAASAALALKDRGISTSLFYLGEYVRDPALIRRTVHNLNLALDQLAEAGLDLHISVDPTQIGMLCGSAKAQENLSRLGRSVRRAALRRQGGRSNWVMLDMEDYGVVAETLKLHDALRREGLPAAITLQAYLYRTATDLAHLIEQGAAIRLVKGAFAERRRVAWTQSHEIDANYLRLARMMLSKKASQGGVRPIFATHDHRLIQRLIALTRSAGRQADSFEFEMLYGVRPDLQAHLVDQGWQVRVYLPFGRDWWPYAIRRVGENVRNVRFLLRAVSNPAAVSDGGPSRDGALGSRARRSKSLPEASR